MMKENPYTSNIWKLQLYRGLRFALLWAPILIIYMQEERGLSMTQIATLDAMFWLSTAIAEIPTGLIADHYGRKHSIFLGTVIYTIAALILATAQTFPMLMVAFIIWGIALTLNSGAEQALLFESLRLSDRENDYPSVASRLFALTQGVQVIGALVGGLLAVISLALPFYVTVLLSFLSCFVVLSLTEPETDYTSPYAKHGEILADAWRLIHKQPDLLRLLLYLAVVPIPFFAIAFIYIQPYALEAGLPIAGFGVLAMIMRIAGAGGSVTASLLVKHYSTQNVLNVIPLMLLGTLLLLSGKPSLAGLGLIGIICFVSAMAMPLGEGLIHKQVPDQIRATVMSLQSLLFTLLFAVLSIPFGIIAENYGLGSIFFALAMLFMVYGGLVILPRHYTASLRGGVKSGHDVTEGCA